MAQWSAWFVPTNIRGVSYWTLYCDGVLCLVAFADELYPGDLHAPNDDNPEITNWEWVASKDYGRNLIKAVEKLGLDAVKGQIYSVAYTELNHKEW